jgi:large subunit ribosomal protein L25
VFYIRGEENINVAIPERSLSRFISTSEARIINLKLSDGSARSCILRAIQFDPVTDQPVHVDLQGLRADEKLTLEIPVVLTGGTPVGVRAGGVLQHIMHRLKISCFPKHIPEHIEVSAEQLGINQSIHVRDIAIENVTILDSAGTTVVAVLPPTVEKVAEPGVAPTEESTEPEVIGKGKKEEEEGVEEAAAKAEAPAKQAAPKKEEKK